MNARQTVSLVNCENYVFFIVQMNYLIGEADDGVNTNFDFGLVE
jgi:hypothetical protein